MAERGTCPACGLQAEIGGIGQLTPHRDRLGKLCQGTGRHPEPGSPAAHWCDTADALAARLAAAEEQLRAARAREFELATELEQTRPTWQVVNAIVGERDVLLHRIDKTLAWCRKANPRPDLNGDQFADIRAALTGTEPNRG